MVIISKDNKYSQTYNISQNINNMKLLCINQKNLISLYNIGLNMIINPIHIYLNKNNRILKLCTKLAENEEIIKFHLIRT